MSDSHLQIALVLNLLGAFIALWGMTSMGDSVAFFALGLLSIMGAATCFVELSQRKKRKS